SLLNRERSSSMPFRSVSAGAAVATRAYVPVSGKYPPKSSSAPRAATARMFFISITRDLEGPVDRPVRPPLRSQHGDHGKRDKPEHDTAASQRSWHVAIVGGARRSRLIRLVERVRKRAHTEADEQGL